MMSSKAKASLGSTLMIGFIVGIVLIIEYYPNWISMILIGFGVFMFSLAIRDLLKVTFDMRKRRKEENEDQN